MPYGVKPTTKDKWKRLWWDIRNIANDEPNPYTLEGEGDLKPVERTAWDDLGHAIRNIIAPRNKDKGSK